MYCSHRQDDGGITQRQQDELVSEFRSGAKKVLVSTSVAEEGVDVETCNLIVRYCTSSWLAFFKLPFFFSFLCFLFLFPFLLVFFHFSCIFSFCPISHRQITSASEYALSDCVVYIIAYGSKKFCLSRLHTTAGINFE